MSRAAYVRRLGWAVVLAAAVAGGGGADAGKDTGKKYHLVLGQRPGKDWLKVDETTSLRDIDAQIRELLTPYRNHVIAPF